MKTFEQTREAFERFLTDYTQTLDCDETIAEAMRYALSGGGKRIRPVLLIRAAEAYCGESDESAYLFATAVELLHTYSLVHDDLPCMDDDDYRRGKLTVHKKFGEAIAVLTGDALLSESFALVVKAMEASGFSDGARRAAALFTKKTGASGLISGQALDLDFGSKPPSVERLTKVYDGKTCALIEAAIGAGAYLGGASDDEANAFIEYAHAFGTAFQLTDDLLDDDASECSALAVLSREQTVDLVDQTIEKGIAALDGSHADCDFFKRLIEDLKGRKR